MFLRHRWCLEAYFKGSQVTGVFFFFFATALIHVGHSHIGVYTNAVELEWKFLRWQYLLYRLSLYAVLIIHFSKRDYWNVLHVIKWCSFSFRNIHILKQQLSVLWEQENHLTLVPGYTGNIAKVIQFWLCSVINMVVSPAVFLLFYLC